MKRLLAALLLLLCSGAHAQSALQTDAFTGTGALSGYTNDVNSWARDADKAAPQATAGGAGAFNLSFSPAATFSGVNDQYAQAEISGKSPGNAPGVVVRWQSGVGGYACYAQFGGNGTVAAKVNGATASNTPIDNTTDTTTDYTSGTHLLRAEISGTTLKCIDNGATKITVVDATYTSGRPALWSFTTDGADRLDNFDAGILQVAGYTYTTLSSLSGTGWPIDVNLLASPAIAVGDILKIPTTTSPGGFAVTQLADGNLSYPGDASRQSLGYSVYDVSVGGWMTPDPATLWFNDQAPVYPQAPLPLVYLTGVAISSLDLCALATDPENDTLTGAFTSGTLPTGLSLGGTGTCTLSGTPTVENESGAAMVFTVTDIAGATAALSVNIYPVTTVTMPSCVATPTDLTTCAETMAAKWLNVIQLQKCNRLRPANRVVSQSVTAGTEVAPFTDVTLTVAKSCPFMGVGR